MKILIMAFGGFLGFTATFLFLYFVVSPFVQGLFK